MLTRSLQVAIPTAAPDAVLSSIAEELKRNGCAIREITASSVAFWGPEPVASSWRRDEQRASVVSEGVVRLDPSGPVRMEVRVGIAQLAWSMLVAVGVALADIHVALRAMVLVMVAAMLWVQVDSARSQVEDWVADGIRKAG